MSDELKDKQQHFLEDGFAPPKIEERILEFWEENKIFEKSLEQTSKGKPYTFYDGPPFATGLPHYGHILASTIKDLIPRYQTMKGRFVRRRWGWDCHGLPIEEIVERKLGISGKKDIEKIGIQRFNEICRSMVLQFAEEWGKMVRRIARWIEFENSYKTMDRDYIESVWWAFKQIYDKGLIYEGRRVLLYCPRCETPVSNFEVAMDNSYKDVTEEAVTAKFKLVEHEARSLKHKNTYLLAWTTTPWTLPGNVALAVGKDIDYVKVKVGEEFYILAKERVQSLGSGAQFVVDKEFKGQDLIGLEYEPLFDVPAVKSDKSHKVYSADFVTTEDGTGIVHTAVVYGEDDYRLGQEVGLPVVPLLDEKGKFNDQAPEFLRGAYFKDADKLVIDDLAIRHMLFARGLYTHSYPHCWRCGTMLFYNAIPAWFINIQKIKKGLIDSNSKEVNWFPAHLKHGRYEKSVEQAPDWNISRNRYWGNPIPIWKCEKCLASPDPAKRDGAITVVGSVKELNLPTTTFYFSRHGEAESNRLNIVSSYPEKKPRDLTPEGEVRAKKMAEDLHKAGGVDVIISSDILRTKHTAEIAGKELGVPVVLDERLREYNVGIWNGKSASEFDATLPRETRWTQAPEGGESWTDIRTRLLDFMGEASRTYPGKRILVISHGDPLWILMQHYNVSGDYPGFASPFKISIDIVDLHRPYIDNVVLSCRKCGGKAKRITEIFDSWVEAGSMPFAEYHYPFENKKLFESRFPAQFVAEYIAQTRAWFYTMHVVSYILFGHAPFENVATTGTILAEDGSKMSKSKNNYPDPWLVIEKYGVDSLRFYLMNSPVMQADNLNFSERELGNIYRRVILLLWNVYNYYATYAAEAGYEPKASGFKLQASGNILDRWICLRAQELVNEVTASLDGYDTVHATRAMQAYIDDLSTWYVRRSRGRKDAEFFATLRHALLVCAKVIAPVMPYMAELVYANLNLKKEIPSVHLAAWPQARELTDAEQKELAAMEVVREAASLGMALRKQLNIPVRQPLPRLAVDTKLADIKLTPELLAVLLSELNVKEADPKLVSEKGDKKTAAPGIKYVQYLYLDTAISDELKVEGLLRALERVIQELRKQKEFKVGEMAVLSYATEDADLIKALQSFNKEKTYIARSEPGKAEEESVVDGKKVRFSLTRA